MPPLKVYLGPDDPERVPELFAFACGLGGDRAAHDYVFVGEGALDRFRARGREHFQRVDSLGEADLAAFPFPYVEGDETAAFALAARGAGKPCVFFRHADRLPPANPPHGVVFQQSIFASRRTPSEQPHPAVINDLLDGREFNLREKNERPLVTFRGFMGTGRLQEFARRLLGGREAFLGSYLRRKAMRVCEASDQVDTRFELLRFGRVPKEERDQLRELYLQSLDQSDYVLCLRGAGNWSFRFYETLCAGRIPVFVNTDSCLPRSEHIDWRRHCVWLEEDEVGQMPRRIREFHDALDEASFRQLQIDNRELWHAEFEPFAFWRKTLGELCGG